MKLNKEQLEMLSDCILSKQANILNVCDIKGIREKANEMLKELRDLNHLICDDIEEVDTLNRNHQGLIVEEGE